MTMSIFLISALGVLVYSGPFLPMLSTLLYRRASPVRFRRNYWALVILTSIQVLSFVPFWIALAHVQPDDEGDGLPLLFLPFLLGIPMLIGTTIYAVRERASLRLLLRSPQAP